MVAMSWNIVGDQRTSITSWIPLKSRLPTSSGLSVFFLTQSDALTTSWDWQSLSFGPNVRVVDEVAEPDSDAIVEYHGVLMSADWPQEIEDAQDLKGYVMHGQPFSRVMHLAAGDRGDQGELCQECGVLKGQFMFPVVCRKTARVVQENWLSAVARSISSEFA